MTASRYTATRQPDILEVIANLSNNEVFTPPRVANEVLDLLPLRVWSDPSLRWLDPGSKTGVFPREITRRLMVGLAEAIPDENARLRHILREMVHAVAVTGMTAMMSRRSLYCSIHADSSFSVTQMSSPGGNVWHQRTEHSFNGRGRCEECGGTRDQLEIDGRDNHAYGFIHLNGRNEILKDVGMKFDVIVGNPPYQLSDGGFGASASPIYQSFIDSAIQLNPRFLLMIVPSRWFFGGKGLADFRERMLSDRRIQKIVDFQDARTLFPDINLNGGVNYFLWDREYDGDCEVTTVDHLGNRETLSRRLDEHDVLVRPNAALSILRKVKQFELKPFSGLVGPRKPFGLDTPYRGHQGAKPKSALLVYQKGGTAWIPRREIVVNENWIDAWKVYIPRATDGNENFPLPVLTEPIVAGPGTVCSETYLLVGPLEAERSAQLISKYMKTRFFRFMLSLRKSTQDNSQEKFAFVPLMPMNRSWTDEDLYNKFGISQEEQDFIATQIREMP